jgi:hypothetical protein
VISGLQRIPSGYMCMQYIYTYSKSNKIGRGSVSLTSTRMYFLSSVTQVLADSELIASQRLQITRTKVNILLLEVSFIFLNLTYILLGKKAEFSRLPFLLNCQVHMHLILRRFC